MGEQAPASRHGRQTDQHKAYDQVQQQDAPVLLFGCMTGYAKEVAEHIARAALSGNMHAFLMRVLVRSFGDAGWQRRQGSTEPGLWCPFDLASWAIDLHWQRQNVAKMRHQTVALGILRYEPDAEMPGRGRLGWNLDFDQWEPLRDDYRRARYTRPGAGRPRKSNVLHSVAIETGESESNVLCPPGTIQSNVLRPVASGEIKQITPDSLETAGEAEETDAPRKVREEGSPKKVEAYASSAAFAVAPMASSALVKPAPVRELTANQRYRVDLLKAIVELRGGEQPPNRQQEWAAAGRFYRLVNGKPTPIETVIACYRAEMQRPAWDSTYLSLMSLLSHYSAYIRNPTCT